MTYAENTFKFVGKLSVVKDSDKFKGYDETTYSSGWCGRKLNLTLTADTNRHSLVIRSGKWNDDSKNVIRAKTKSGHDANGNRTKGEAVQIPFAERFDPEWKDKVSGRNKYVLDITDPEEKQRLKDIISSNRLPDDGEFASMDAVHEALDGLGAYRKEFLSDWDFAEQVYAFLSDDNTPKNMKYEVRGNVVHEYNPSKGVFYTNFVPNRIVCVGSETPCSSSGVVDFYFSENAVDGDYAEDSGWNYLNGYTRYYESAFKKVIGAPIQLRFANDPEKYAEIMKKKFAAESETYRHIGLNVDYINGAQRQEITYDMLSDEQKESIDFGLTTLSAIKQEMGGTVYGEREQYVKITGFAVGFSAGAEDTVYTKTDFDIPAAETETKSDDLFDDLMDDDELEIII